MDISICHSYLKKNIDMSSQMFFLWTYLNGHIGMDISEWTYRFAIAFLIKKNLDMSSQIFLFYGHIGMDISEWTYRFAKAVLIKKCRYVQSNSFFMDIS